MTITAQLLANALRAAANVLDGSGGAAQVAQHVAAPLGGTVTGTTVTQQQPVVQQPVVQQPQASNITDKMLLDLIQPHLGNDAIKQALGNAMRGMGIGALPEAQPHQYAPLYAAFQQVLSQFGVGAAAPQQAASTSII